MSGNPPPSHLAFRIHRLVCIDETDPEPWGHDEMYIGAIVINSDGTSNVIPSFYAGGKIDDDDVRSYDPPRQIALFDLNANVNWPKKFIVSVIMAEEDSGNLNDILYKVWPHVQEKADAMVGKGAAAAGDSIIPGSGPVVSAAAVWIFEKFIDWLTSFRADDVFPPIVTEVDIPSANARFPGGVSEYANSEARSAHGGEYRVDYDWKLVSGVIFYADNGSTVLTDDSVFSDIKPFTFSGGWSHIVNISDTTVLFHNKLTGAATLANKFNFTTVKTFVFAGGWTHIININNEKILFYNTKNGAATLTNNSNFSALNIITLANGWTHIVSIGSGRVLFYNTNNGAGIVTDNSNFAEIKKYSFSGGWTHILHISYGRVLFYNSKTGASTLTYDSDFTTDKTFAFAGGWSHIINADYSSVFFYNSVSGAATLTNNSNFSVIRTFALAGGWKLISHL